MNSKIVIAHYAKKHKHEPDFLNKQAAILWTSQKSRSELSDFTFGSEFSKVNCFAAQVGRPSASFLDGLVNRNRAHCVVQLVLCCMRGE